MDWGVTIIKVQFTIKKPGIAFLVAKGEAGLAGVFSCTY